VTLADWLRSQPRPERCGRTVRGSPSMSDTEFGLLMADPGAGLPAVSQQAVGLWRTGRRMPRAAYVRRIGAVTGGAVTEADLRATFGERARCKRSSG
jgi:hypothetical protein